MALRMIENKVVILNDLPSSKDSKDDYIIKVRVIRLWENHIFDYPDQVISLDMILIDEAGNMVHGSIHKKLIYRFERTISEDKCYIMRNVSIGDYSNRYQYVDNDKKVNLYLKCVVKPCEDFGGDRNGFKFHDLDHIINKVTPSETIVDVVAYVSYCAPILEITKGNGIQTKMMNLRLKGFRNKDTELKLTLWGSYAVQMSEYIRGHPDLPPLFIVLQFGLFKIREGSPSVSNSVNVSKLYINEDMTEINEFKKRYVELMCPEPSSSSHISLSGPTICVPLRDDFLNSTEFNHINELEELHESATSRI